MCVCVILLLYLLQHHYNKDYQVTGSHLLSTTEYKVGPTLSLPKGKENNRQVTEQNKVLSDQDEGVIKKQEYSMLVPTARTVILREWII